MTRKRFIAILPMLAVPALCLAQSGVLRVEIGRSRGAGAAMEQADQAVRRFSRNLASLMPAPRQNLARAGRWHDAIPLSMPVVVRLTQNGRGLPGPQSGGRSPGLTLEFDTSGSRTFPPVYQQLLIDTFTKCESTLDAVFGVPSLNGTVHVRSYDADIGDRHAVSGGYYVNDNGAGEREIRYPVYQNEEAAAVNFVHCLLLAYLGPSAYGFDAFQEGLVRAATMRVCRTPGALPASLDAALIEQVLENTYDVGPWYDWYNQRPLGGPLFIAPNLISAPLPSGGSIGGIYLLRYKMSGSSWQKALSEYPAFIKLFNQGLYADPGIGDDPAALALLGQSVLDTITGSSGSTLEGRSFSEWARRQFILETGLTLGRKLLLEPVPLAPDSGTSDFGVFLLQATFFETLPGSNETLLSGLSYPIFWTEAFDRIFPSAQEDRMDIAGAYGSVVPNLPDFHVGKAYRCTVDIPVQDRIARAYLPAGGIATGASTTPNDFYGTVTGVSLGVSDTLRVRVSMGASTVDNIEVTFGAFGKRIDTSEYLGYQKLHVEVIKTSGANDTVVVERWVNKGPGPLALDLRSGDGEATFAYPNGLPKGLSAIGLPVDPFPSLFGEAFGIPESQVLAARWNGTKAKYDIYPDGGGPVGGNGYFARIESANPGFAVTGRTSPGTPVAIALRPGWNLVSNPIPEAVPTTRVTVIHSIDFPKTFSEALGAELGLDFFEFAPGPNDAATGAPETGTMVKAAQFEPGKAYFVRVLSAEGVTLMFEPASTFGPQHQRSPQSASDPLSPIRYPLSSIPEFLSSIPYPLSVIQSPMSVASSVTGPWTLRVSLSRAGHEAEAYLGQARSASFGFDPAEDSGLSPGMGGMQLTVQGPEAMYREIRPLFSWTTYRIQATGLVPGKTHTVHLDMVLGALRQYEFRDRDVFYVRRLNGSHTYTFRATRSSRTLEVRVGAGSF